MEFIKPGRQFDFMGKRWYFIGLSAALLVLSLFSFVTPGPKLGTDFKGGTEVEIAFKAAVSAGDVRAAVEKVGFTSPEVVQVADTSNAFHFLIRVQEITVLTDKQKDEIRSKMCHVDDEGKPRQGCDAKSSATEIKFSPGGDKITSRYDVKPDIEAIRAQLTGIEGVHVRAGKNSVVVVNEREHKVDIELKSKGDQLLDSLRTQIGEDKVPERALRVEWVGPKAGAQLRNDALWSVGVASFFIMLYIAFRFDLRFAPGGILALIHDVGIAMGAMIMFKKEITISTVAAMLTIVGYSITDTVVVYDRVRENLTKHRNMSFSQVINLSVSEMLGRTIITSGVTALSMVCFLVWGTGVIKDFAFALLIGILVGTYSSIYVAAPFTEWIDRRFFGGSTQSRKVARTKATKRADAVV